ncbi:IS30 family transposase, partial [Patescibacteria group bacterium]|nr:IS30 family transposase [Patescibacteria group bacterium]
SWQKGSNEYHNGLLRRYFPKGTDFSKVEQEEIDDIIEEINNRPRKILGYSTPNEVFAQNLSSVRIKMRM